jgi:hypothetical protein
MKGDPAGALFIQVQKKCALVGKPGRGSELGECSGGHENEQEQRGAHCIDGRTPAVSPQ